MSKRTKPEIKRAEVVAVITEMLEDAFGGDDDVWYSVDIKTEGMQMVRMRIRARIDGKDAKLSLIFDPGDMVHVDAIRPAVDDAIRAVIRCKADPSLIGE